MTTVKEIEAAVERLSAPSLDEFRTWFAEFDAASWDREFEQDAIQGALDGLADEALRDLDNGRCTKL